MSDKTGIEWPGETPITDRGGSRTRYYKRLDASTPGQQLRRRMAAIGLKWCRDCRQWLSSGQVTKNGLCADHERARYRELYAKNRAEICSAKVARKRGVAVMPEAAKRLIAELFGGLCGYCGKPYQSWDHAVAVSKGGVTEPGNMIPACTSCNSSKKDMDLVEWLERKAPSPLPYTFEYLAFAGVL